MVQADSTISKLMEERSIGSQHRESLQQELVRVASSNWLHSCFFYNGVITKLVLMMIDAGGTEDEEDSERSAHWIPSAICLRGGIH